MESYNYTHRPRFSFPEGEALADEKVCDADKLSSLVGAEQCDRYGTLTCQLLQDKRGRDMLKVGHCNNKEKRSTDRSKDKKVK